MDLILWRHAQAEDPRFDQDDLARQLTAKGKKQARLMAAWLTPRLPAKVRIISSPALRTSQTADALALPYTVIDDIAPDASLEALLQVLRRQNGEDTVLLVGHQPTLGQLAATLLAGATLDWSIKKGAVWWLQDCTSTAPQLRLVLDPADAGAG